MKNIIVLGNSFAGIKTAEEIRELDSESEIAVFCQESVPPVNRERFAEYFKKEISESQFLYQSAKFYQEKKITIVLDKKIAKINLNRKYLTIEEKEKVPFEILVLADTGDIKFPDIKGTNKDGVFSFRGATGFHEVFKRIPLCETIVVESAHPDGVKAADALRKRGREVLLISPSEYLLAGYLEREVSALLTKSLEQSGIRVFTECRISEILGESEVRAVRLSSGKVFSGEMVIFADAPDSLRKLMDTPLEMNDRICVDAAFKTNVEGVFAVGDICEFRQKASGRIEGNNPDVAQEQARVVAVNIAGTPAEFDASLSVRLFNVEPFLSQQIQEDAQEAPDAPGVEEATKVSEGRVE